MRWLAELWLYRELFYFLAWRDVKIRYNQTLLGVGWAILQPLLSMVIFVFLFGRLARLSTDGVPAGLFYYAALVPWIYFSGTLALCSNSLLANAQLLKKVYFPRAILPAAVALAGLVDFTVSAVCVAGLLVYYHVAPTWNLLLWIPLTGLLVVLTIGVGMLLSALTLKYRDVKYAVPFLIQVGFFVTPIIYPLAMLPERYRVLAALNPLSGIVETFRATLVPAKPVEWDVLGTSVLVTALLVLAGIAYFRRAERYFADLV